MTIFNTAEGEKVVSVERISESEDDDNQLDDETEKCSEAVDDSEMIDLSEGK